MRRGKVAAQGSCIRVEVSKTANLIITLVDDHQDGLDEQSFDSLTTLVHFEYRCKERIKRVKKIAALVAQVETALERRDY